MNPVLGVKLPPTPPAAALMAPVSPAGAAVFTAPIVDQPNFFGTAVKTRTHTSIGPKALPLAITLE